VKSVDVTAQSITITVTSTQTSAICPLCGSEASRVHSRYMRHIADLPCGGRQVHLVLQVRKFFCDATICPRKIFAERLTSSLNPGPVSQHGFIRLSRSLVLPQAEGWESVSLIDWEYRPPAGRFSDASWLFPPSQLNRCHRLASMTFRSGVDASLGRSWWTCKPIR
jgi:zinc-finger of transposase IS204/IS1001/IS1096/IS1165